LILTNKLSYPEAYVALATNNSYEPNPGRIGVTALIKSPQIRRLQIEHWKDIVADVGDFFKGIMGNANHKALELNCPPGYKAEQKWEYNVDGLILVGKADLNNGGIEDYKFLSAWSWVFGEDAEWIEQLNCLNWLKVKNGGEPAKYLKVHAFIVDWSEYQARDKSYPQQKYLAVDIPIWPLEETEHFIRQRISLHKNPAYTCSDADKWVKLEKWAVMKKDGKKAERLLDTAQEAEAYIMQRKWQNDYANGKIYIEQRKTRPRNCESYCIARSVCEFAKGLNNV
jgi:hypothetical protein